MKNKKLFAMATLIVAIVILSSLTVTALAFTGYEAFEPTRLDELYTATNTYKCTNVDSENRAVTFDLENKRNVQVMDTTQITVLTHGLGGNAGAWSNAYSKDNADATFAYDEDSIINKIREKAGDANVYWAKMTDIQTPNIDENANINELYFTLYNITYVDNGEYLDNPNAYAEDKISDISKHIIIVFEANEPSKSNDSVYFEFNYMLSKIIYDVMLLNGGILPKVNLIGHSRGGLTNMQYALDHPDIVDSLISFGTPYFGTTTGKLSAIMGESEGLTSILDPEIFSDYSKRWNDDYTRLYKNINAVALAGYSSLTFLGEAVLNDVSDFFDDFPDIQPAIDKLMDVLTAIKISSMLNTPLVDIGLARITEVFEIFFPSSVAVSLAEAFFQEINLDWHPPFVSWYNDICVNLESQLAMSNINIYGGFTYFGFKHRTRYFGEGDGTDFYKVATKNVPVPHNLEPRDAKMIKWAVDEIDVGFGKPNGFTYTVNESGSVSIDGYVGSAISVVTIPQSINNKPVTEIAPYAFEGILDELEVKSVYVPDTIQKIGEGAFANNKLLENVLFGESSCVKQIGSFAFANCEKLNGITIPQTVTELGDSAFYGCCSIDAYDVAEENANYISDNGVIYTKGQSGNIGSVLISYPMGKADQVFSVPSTVTEISAFAFYGSRLESINLNNVIMVRDFAFYNCDNLSVINGSNVKYVENGALQGTAWLNGKIAQSQDFISLGQALYRYDGADENIVLDGYVSVTPMAFAGNCNIKTVTVCNGMTTLGEMAFYECCNLQTVYISNSNNLVFVGSNTFENNANGRLIYIPACLKGEYDVNEIWQKYDTSVHQTNINYNLDGGTIENDNYLTAISYGGFVDLPVPVKEHYVFAGWFVDEDCTLQQLVDGTQWLSYDGEVNLYAKWVPVNYTVTLDLQDEAQTKQMLDYAYGQAVQLPVAERKGYIFGGWFYDKQLNQSVGDELSNAASGDFTLYAKWIAKTYTVTYDLGFENTSEIEAFETQTTVTYNQPYSLQVLNRDKYYFNGWKAYDGTFYCQQDGTSCFAVWQYDGDITLKADWTGWSYYIKISNDGKVTWVTDESKFDSYKSPIEYGTELETPDKLAEQFNPDDVSLKEGHRFKYFVKSLDSTAPIGNWSELYDRITQDGCIIEIYPYFVKERNFTLDFLGYATQPNVNPFVSDYGAEITYFTPTKIGHTFRCWKVAGTDIASSNARFDGTYLAAGNVFNYATMPDLSINTEEEGVHIYLIAVFTPNTYVITLNTAYGTLSNSKLSIDYDTKKTLEALRVTGRTFNGWYTANGTKIADKDGNMLSNWRFVQDTDLYADWTAIVYTVSYIGGYTNNNKTTFTVDDLPFNLSNPTRSGYRFMGWYTSSSYSTRVYTVNAVGNKTLYAKWAEIFTVSFNSNSGSACSPVQGISGEVITLPTSVKGGYKGTWSYWGYLTNSSDKSNFGLEYTIGASNTTFMASWKEKTTKECYNASVGAYEIYTYNQLNGIRDLNRTGTPGGNYLNVNISLKSDIKLVNNWIPIDANYSGTFNGNYYKITGMKIVISGTGYYGLFTILDEYGTVKNLNFEDVNIKNSITDDQFSQNYSDFETVCVGVVAGYSNGSIMKCTVASGVIDVTLRHSLVGGIAGFSNGVVLNCINKGAHVSGYGIIGGIAGANSAYGNVELCYNYSNVTYTYYKESGCAAGIVGKNLNGATVTNCKNYGTIIYSGKYTWNANIRPCIAQIVGWKVGGSLNGNVCNGSCSFDNMTIGQKTYCSSGEVGRTGA